MLYFVILTSILMLSPSVQAQASTPHQKNGWTKLDEGQWCLWKNGVQVGNVRDGEFYRMTSPTTWDKEPSEPPVPIPEAARGGIRKPRCGCSAKCRCKANKCGCSAAHRCHNACCCHQAADPKETPASVQKADVRVEKNFGVDLVKLEQEPPNHSTVSGRTVSKEELLQAIEGKPEATGKNVPVPNDTNLLCLTAIGSPAACQEVLNDLKKSPHLRDWQGRLKVKSYSPDHWAVRDAGFKADGSPTIYLQKANGEVLHRQDEYRGPEALAEALRIADPQYNPEKDPDLNRRGFNGHGGWAIVWGVLVLLVLAGAGFFFILCLLAALVLAIRLLNRPIAE